MLGWIALLLAASALGARAGETVRPPMRLYDFAHQRLADGRPEGWTTWAPRQEIAPAFSVSQGAGLDGRAALTIETAEDAAAIGAWRRTVQGIEPGKTYRFSASYRARGVRHERRCVFARLDWLDERGNRARPPDYALDAERKGDWTWVEHVATAPPNARSVRIELGFGWCPRAAVWWDDIKLEEEPAPPRRLVRVGTVYCRPSRSGSPEESLEQFCKLVEGMADRKPDIVCLPEGVTVVGTDRSYAEVAEPVPGPTTRRLGELARRLGCYVAAGLYERAGKVVYNTAVLVGRKGELVGRYRKTHLPREEVEGGITPGDEYPVFETDFGRVAMLICWDVQFPEPWRALALKGAELVLLPIWGGSEVLARARAIENHLTLVSSSYDMRCFVVDPEGKVLAEATKERPTAVAEVDLDREILQEWLGNMKPRTWKERRPDLAGELAR